METAQKLIEPSEPDTLYQELVAAGVPIDSHESDLYCLVCSESIKLVAKHDTHKTASTFRSEIDGKLWLDCPFKFDPWWDKRLKTEPATP
jgi:hypothetical protein